MDFDEFGNPIGVEEEPEVKVEEDDFIALAGGVEDENDDDEEEDYMDDLDADLEDGGMAVSLRDTYGDQVEVLVEREDRDGDKPILENAEVVKQKEQMLKGVFSKRPLFKFDSEYLQGMMSVPERIRTCCILGPLHSGKTSLLDIFVTEHYEVIDSMSKNVKLGWKQMRYLDNMKQEMERGVSLKLNGITFLATDNSDKSYAMTMLDTPGHVDFIEDAAVAMAVSDTALICIDVVEGITATTRYMIKECQKNKLSMVFILNKLDRLILELRLSPLNSFRKMARIIADIQSITRTKGCYSPENGNIIFASAKFGMSFTIEQFVTKYYGSVLSKTKRNEFIRRLWGSYCYEKGVFKLLNQDSTNLPTFVTFILDPIYKVFMHTLSREVDEVAAVVKKYFNVILSNEEKSLDPQPLLKKICQGIFDDQKGIITSIIKSIDDYGSFSAQKFHHLTGLPNFNMSSDKEFLGHAVKVLDYVGSDWTLMRIHSGEITVGSKVKVLEAVDIGDSNLKYIDEDLLLDASKVSITGISLLCGRFLAPITKASAGQTVLVKGVASAFTKSASVFADAPKSIGLPLFHALDYIGGPVFKAIIAPLNPKELPKLLHGLDSVNKYYPCLQIRVEESGEHVVLGTGELYFDCLMQDLRNLYSKIEIKISDPVTTFSEGCQEESFAAIPVESTSNNITITVSAERLDKKIVQDISKKRLVADVIGDKKELRTLAKRLREEYGWDSLSARNVWASFNTNFLVDDTLPDETDKNLLNDYRDYILQGFYWAMKEGPLMEEPMYGIKFKILKFEIGHNSNVDVPIIGAQIIPLMRKACYVGLMTAKPMVMEPVYEMDIVMKEIYYPALEDILRKRRSAHIYSVESIVGTPLIEVKTQIPVIDSFGIETDIRLAAQGNAIVQSHHWNKIWRKVPGDVLDEDAPIPKLKPAPTTSLARDFAMKTRRRKGISNDGFMSNDGPTLQKYISRELFDQLKEAGLV
ncbi:Uncharacterized protein RNJ44_01788 [Nakaseomyces bracarensis]|uniref:Tr-type G domain-containing protein n=1 Tax=Nakaseomyces bracarensis TaxID=273131 RepID=A0ABR4NNZ3_9SACH